MRLGALCIVFMLLLASSVFAAQQGERAHESAVLENVSADVDAARRRIADEAFDVPVALRETVREHEQARVATQAIERIGEENGWCGTSMCAAAYDIEARINDSLRLEERARTRSTLARMLFGGDRDAARQMLNITEQNRLRIDSMNASIDSCPCTNETRLMLREQLMMLEHEQMRLESVAREQLQMRGWFRWFG